MNVEQVRLLLAIQARTSAIAFHDDSCLHCKRIRIIAKTAQDILDSGNLTDKSLTEWVDESTKRLEAVGLTWLGVTKDG